MIIGMFKQYHSPTSPAFYILDSEVLFLIIILIWLYTHSLFFEM